MSCFAHARALQANALLGAAFQQHYRDIARVAGGGTDMTLLHLAVLRWVVFLNWMQKLMQLVVSECMNETSGTVDHS